MLTVLFSVGSVDETSNKDVNKRLERKKKFLHGIPKKDIS